MISQLLWSILKCFSMKCVPSPDYLTALPLRCSHSTIRPSLARPKELFIDFSQFFTLHFILKSSSKLWPQQVSFLLFLLIPFFSSSLTCYFLHLSWKGQDRNRWTLFFRQERLLFVRWCCGSRNGLKFRSRHLWCRRFRWALRLYRTFIVV